MCGSGKWCSVLTYKRKGESQGFLVLCIVKDFLETVAAVIVELCVCVCLCVLMLILLLNVVFFCCM